MMRGQIVADRFLKSGPYMIGLMVASTVGCAAPRTKPTPSDEVSRRPAQYVVKVVQANIDRESPDHKPWHLKKPHVLRHMLDIVGPLHPVLSGMAAVADEADGNGGAVPPSPMVQVNFNDDSVVESPPIPVTLRPRWNWSFAVDMGKYALDTKVTIKIVDADDSDGGGPLLAKFSTTVGELISGTMPEDRDSVRALQIAVTPDRRVQPIRHHFAVPANHAEIQRIHDSESDSKAAWHAIDVLNGDVIRISATGTVTIDSAWQVGTDPLGPSGREPDMGFHPQPLAGCKETPHRGSLVAVISGKCMEIGAEKQIRMMGDSGQMFLLVNDADNNGRNSGAFDVTVDVIPPSAQSTETRAERAEE